MDVDQPALWTWTSRPALWYGDGPRTEELVQPALDQTLTSAGPRPDTDFCRPQTRKRQHAGPDP